MTDKQKIIFKIGTLKSKLCATNDEAIMYAVGEISADEYAETKKLRETYRNEINTLEQELNNLKE